MLNCSSKNIEIYFSSKNEIVNYAVKELSKYLNIMTECQSINIVQTQSMISVDSLELRTGIFVGLFGEFNISTQGVSDPFLDDEIYANIISGKGIIAGVNPRSVLYAVYRMLSANGCVWVRPGYKGENIPKKPLNGLNACLHEKPAYRHRGIDFGGLESQEDALEFIRWVPKLGFNAIFFEGPYPHRIFGGSTVQIQKQHLKEAVTEIKKLGLLYHGAGHGFNCLPIGLDFTFKGEPDENVKSHIAMIKGKREFQRRGPVDTNLCYSNPETRKIMVNYMVNFAKENPEIDFMHIWIADGVNNHCECDECQKYLPSDLYIEILNELDAQLIKNNLSTKIVLISYTDLIWKPKYETLENPQRFILIHAPHFRSYRRSFLDVNEIPQIPAYNRNNNTYPLTVEDNVAFINDWQEYFPGDSFLFEYHLWIAQFVDLGQYKLSEILYKDIKSIKKLGVNGYMSCGYANSFLPVGLAMHIMGKTLWNDGVTFEDLIHEYFKSAFGNDWQKCLSYVKGISDFLDPDLRGENGPLKKEDSERYENLIYHIANFRSIIEINITNDNCCCSTSWNYLKIHADIVTLLAFTLENKSLGKGCKARVSWNLLEKYLLEHKDEIESVFSVNAYIKIQGKEFEKGRY